MAEEKKYSLITLDKGSADEAAPHKTNEAYGEETIVVSSARGVSTKPTTDAPSAQAAASLDDPQQQAVSQKPAQERPTKSAQGTQGTQSKPSTKEPSQDDEGVPFQRMQTAIIICLIAVIVIFLVYFNFLR